VVGSTTLSSLRAVSSTDSFFFFLLLPAAAGRAAGAFTEPVLGDVFLFGVLPRDEIFGFCSFLAASRILGAPSRRACEILAMALSVGISTQLLCPTTLIASREFRLGPPDRPFILSPSSRIRKRPGGSCKTIRSCTSWQIRALSPLSLPSV